MLRDDPGSNSFLPPPTLSPRACEREVQQQHDLERPLQSTLPRRLHTDACNIEWVCKDGGSRRSYSTKQKPLPLRYLLSFRCRGHEIGGSLIQIHTRTVRA